MNALVFRDIMVVAVLMNHFERLLIRLSMYAAEVQLMI